MVCVLRLSASFIQPSLRYSLYLTRAHFSLSTKSFQLHRRFSYFINRENMSYPSEIGEEGRTSPAFHVGSDELEAAGRVFDDTVYHATALGETRRVVDSTAPDTCLDTAMDSPTNADTSTQLDWKLTTHDALGTLTPEAASAMFSLVPGEDPSRFNFNCAHEEPLDRTYSSKIRTQEEEPFDCADFPNSRAQKAAKESDDPEDTITISISSEIRRKNMHSNTLGETVYGTTNRATRTVDLDNPSSLETMGGFYTNNSGFSTPDSSLRGSANSGSTTSTESGILVSIWDTVNSDVFKVLKIAYKRTKSLIPFIEKVMKKFWVVIRAFPKVVRTLVEIYRAGSARAQSFTTKMGWSRHSAVRQVLKALAAMLRAYQSVDALVRRRIIPGSNRVSAVLFYKTVLILLWLSRHSPFEACLGPMEFTANMNSDRLPDSFLLHDRLHVSRDETTFDLSSTMAAFSGSFRKSSVNRSRTEAVDTLDPPGFSTNGNNSATEVVDTPDPQGTNDSTFGIL